MLNDQVARQVIDHGIFLGADFVELFVEHHQSSCVSTINSQVSAVESGIDFGIGIRLIYSGKVLYAFTNNTNKNELLRIVDELAAKERREPNLKTFTLQFENRQGIHPSKISLSHDYSIESKIDFLLSANHISAQTHPKISQNKSICRQREQQVEIFNSEGLHVRDTRHYCRVRIDTIASNGNEQSMGSWNHGGLKGWELVDELDPQTAGESSGKQALVTLGAKPCPSGEMPVIIGNGFGGIIFHEACGHILETTSVAKKASVFHDRLNTIVANPKVNAVDDGTLVNGWGSSNIDDEGMTTQRTQLIKDGVLTNFMSDKLGAEKINKPRTGSGRRLSYQYAPASRMRNTFIEAGKDKLQDMIASVDKGLYALGMGGGSVNAGTGEFNFATVEAYLIENGKVTHPVKSATLIGSGPKVLKNISMVGDDFDIACGVCYSISGEIPVMMGQPSIKVDNILVGGAA